MLTELGDIQSSDESVEAVELSFDIETRIEEGGERVARTYTFDYAKEWDKWTFVEFYEERAKDDALPSERVWRQTQHIMWYDVDETPDITVPPEVTDALQKATGAKEIIIQRP
jgi:hypothetical protein